MDTLYSCCLIADIGGTYTRLALVDPQGNKTYPQRLENDQHARLYDALTAYISALPPACKPDAAVIAVAGPVRGDYIRITNRDWHFSIQQYCSLLSFRFLHVINDFVAVALAIPALEKSDYIQIGNGHAVADKPIGIVGPGTGLGVSFLIPEAGRWIPVNSEGGHVTLAANNEQEEIIISFVRKQYGHVSAERLVSGSGLPLLYQAIAGIEGQTADRLTPEAIIWRDEQRTDPVATRTVDVFLEMLGTVAANLAVTIGAEGGIYFAGGILPRMPQRLCDSGFRQRFVHHDRYSQFLDQIPTCLIIRENTALDGLRYYLSVKGSD